ncbi:tryptophan 2,3-dioxygenase [bacterium AH-315-P15]|nr:tryptophan 2,3-dioxygenase [bacterium AH-315-P15]
MHYGEYLQLDKLLDCQAPESDRQGRPAHDEHLFIIIHQTYELWFKQVLHEIGLVQKLLGGETFDERDGGRVVQALGRVLEIMRVAIHQVDILETMTPMDFLEFRDLLFPASGFQSLQFRLVETRLGLRKDERVQLDGQDVDLRLKPHEQKKLEAAYAQPSLRDHLDAWLSRTPFLDHEDFSFRKAYMKALEGMLEHEAGIIRTQPQLSAADRDAQLANLTRAGHMLDAILDDAAYEALKDSGAWTFSRRALEAALFINLYRDEPALQMPFRILSAVMDIDEAMTNWRARHALMAQRMIGQKVGTGGSSGHSYLNAAAQKHKVFGDLFALATFMLPRSNLPALPASLNEMLHYHYVTAV